MLLLDRFIGLFLCILLRVFYGLSVVIVSGNREVYKIRCSFYGIYILDRKIDKYVNNRVLYSDIFY